MVIMIIHHKQHKNINSKQNKWQIVTKQYHKYRKMQLDETKTREINEQ